MLKDSIVLTFSKGIRGVLMVVFNMIIARVFSETLYGIYKQSYLIMNLSTSIFVLGIPTTISYLYATAKRENKEKLIGNTLLILSMISFVTSFVLLVFKNQIALLLNNEQLVNYINVISIYVSIMIISSFLENLYISSNSAVLLGKIYIVYVIINFAVISFIAVSSKNLNMLLIAMATIELLRTLIMYFSIIKKEKLKLKLDYNYLLKQIKFALPLGAVSIIQNVNLYVDNLFISNQFTVEEYAAYANAAQDIPLVGIITVSIAAVILPRMSKYYHDTNDPKGVLKLWGDSCEKTAIVMFPLFWIFLFYSSSYIEFIFSEVYVQRSTPIFVIYLLKFPLYFTVFGNPLIVLKQQKYVMINSFIGMVTNIILNTIFLMIFGMKGPAISTVITQYFIDYLILRKISKTTNIPITKVLPYKKLLKILVIPSVVVIPIYLLSRLTNLNYFIEFALSGGTIYILSILIYYKLGYFKIDDIKSLVKR